MTRTATDFDLIAGVKAGENHAYEALLREYGPRLLATARRMCRNEDDACDVLQDALAQCLRNVSRFKGDSSLYTWLHRVVVTTALMRLRKRKRRSEAAIEPLLPRFFDDGHRVGSLRDRDWENSPGQLVSRRELAEVVRHCVEQLPTAYREVVTLRDIEGIDTAAAAEFLGVNEGVVKTRLHRARQALRTLLEPYVAGSSEYQTS